MKVTLIELNEKKALAALRAAIRWARRNDVPLKPPRLKVVLADHLADCPLERELLAKAIDLNATSALAAATTQHALRGTARSLVYELVRRHVSAAGAEFVVTVLVKAVRGPTACEHSPPQPRDQSRNEPIVTAPIVDSTLRAADLETELDSRLARFEYSTITVQPAESAHAPVHTPRPKQRN